MRCSCAGSPSSSAGGKHCSCDSGSSAKTQSKEMNTSSCIPHVSLNATHLLVVAGDAAEVAVELVSTICYTFLSLCLVIW